MTVVTMHGYKIGCRDDPTLAWQLPAPTGAGTNRKTATGRFNQAAHLVMQRILWNFVVRKHYLREATPR